MSICVTCFKAKTLPCCLTTLFVGAIGIVNLPVMVYIKDITTGRIQNIAASSDGSGNVEIDLSEKSFFDNHAYEMWITAAGADFSDKEIITIAGQQYYSVCMDFDTVTNTDGGAETFAEATIS